MKIHTEDDQAIRRAVWSSFHRNGHTQCPYPVEHHHREIWIDEAAAIAAEFTDEILAEAPQAEVIELDDFLREVNFQEAMRLFGELPIYEVQNGEAVPFPTEQPDEEPLPAAAIH